MTGDPVIPSLCERVLREQIGREAHAKDDDIHGRTRRAK